MNHTVNRLRYLAEHRRVTTRKNLQARIDQLETKELGHDSRVRELERRLEIAQASTPQAKDIIRKVLNHRPFSDLCAIGAGDVCVAHFNEHHCSVAWAKSWCAGYVSTDGMASLALVLTGQPEGLKLISDILGRWADDHELDGAYGTPAEAATARHRIRLARAVAHAASADV